MLDSIPAPETNFLPSIFVSWILICSTAPRPSPNPSPFIFSIKLIYYSSDIIPEVNDLLKTAEDFNVPKELSETLRKVNDPASKFRNTFDIFRDEKLAETKASRKELNIMGFNINNSGVVMKLIYVALVVAIVGIIYYLSTKVLVDKSNINPKHMPQKSRKDKNKKKK